MRVFAFLAFVFLLLFAPQAQAQITDAPNDLLPGYTGPQAGDVDVLATNVAYNGSAFTITATMNGNIGATPGAFYVWGFDRGQGTARFASIAPGVLFDSVVILRPDTTLSVNRIVGGTSTNFGAGTVSINGATLSATVAASELPSLGLTPGQYTYNLWPRVGSGNNNQISDFAPNNSNASVLATPEGGTLLLWASLVPIAIIAIQKNRKRQNV